MLISEVNILDTKYRFGVDRFDTTLHDTHYYHLAYVDTTYIMSRNEVKEFFRRQDLIPFPRKDPDVYPIMDGDFRYKHRISVREFTDLEKAKIKMKDLC